MKVLFSYSHFQKSRENPYYKTSRDRGLCAAVISEGIIQGFRGTGSYEKVQVEKEGRSCAVFPSIGAVSSRIRVEPEPTENLQIG